MKVAITLPAALHLKPEEVDTPEKRAKYTVCIIGYTLRGLFCATIFAEAGFKVICVDANQSTVKKLAKGNSPLVGRELESKLKSLVKMEKIIATSDLKAAVSKSEIVLIAVDAKVDLKKNSDYNEVASYCKQVGATLQRGHLVIYAGIAGFGFIETVFREILENTSGLRAGEDFGLAYVPFQNAAILNGDAVENQVVIAGADKTSLNSAATVFASMAKKGIKLTSDMKTAELAILFQVTRQYVNVALANELAILCENSGVDYVETLKVLTNSSEIFSTMPTIDENGQNETSFLLESAENLNIKLRLLPLSMQINDEMLKHALNLTQDALRCGEKTLRRAKIGILGTSNSGIASRAFVELLESKGAKIIHYNPQGYENTLEESGGRIFKKTINETAEGTDCIVIMSEQEQLKKLNLKKLRAIMKSPAAIIDLTGTIEPAKALGEDFAYRGLGRGAWKN